MSQAPANNLDTVFNLATVLDRQRKRPTPPNGLTQFIIWRNMRLPAVDAWNFSIQRQLSNTISLDLSCVGNKGTHVFAGTGGHCDPNQASLDGFGVTVGSAFRTARYVLLQRVCVDGKGEGAVPRGVVQLHQSHEFGAAQWKCGQSWSEWAHLQCDRQFMCRGWWQMALKAQF